MEYLNKTFSVGVGTKEYRDGWERIFGKDQDATQEIEEATPQEEESSCEKATAP